MRMPIVGRSDELAQPRAAPALVLSERTVEGHVRSILAKLGYATRTEIATWSLRGAQATAASAPDKARG
jgi:hypothetical protein